MSPAVAEQATERRHLEGHRMRVTSDYRPAVWDEGSGPAVLLLHGTPLDAHAWDGLAPLLARGRRVIRYDLRGHGSASASVLPDELEPLAADLVAVLDEVELDSAHLVGHSFGGEVAQTAALLAPERVSGLTMLCTRSAPFPPFAAAAERIASGAEPDVEGVLARWFSPAARAAAPASLRYARSCLGSISSQTYATALRAMARFDVRQRLGELSLPVDLFAAEHDMVATPEDTRAAAALLSRSRFHLIPDAWHMAPVERPRQLSAALLTAWAKPPEQGRTP